MFYSILALLVTKQLSTSKHRGVISYFDKEFVKTSILPKELSKGLHIAFDRRQIGDYGEMREITKEMAQQTIVDAKNIVSEIEKFFKDMQFL